MSATHVTEREKMTMPDCPDCLGDTYTVCPDCDGTGEGSTEYYNCRRCRGNGVVGCNKCGGTGEVEYE